MVPIFPKIVKQRKISLSIPNDRKEFNEGDKKNTEKNYKVKEILVCGMGIEEYNQGYTYDYSKEI